MDTAGTTKLITTFRDALDAARRVPVEQPPPGQASRLFEAASALANFTEQLQEALAPMGKLIGGDAVAALAALEDSLTNPVAALAALEDSLTNPGSGYHLVRRNEAAEAADVNDRHRPECKVCAERANDDGEIHHGKGCYEHSEDGGGIEATGWRPVRKVRCPACDGGTERVGAHCTTCDGSTWVMVDDRGRWFHTDSRGERHPSPGPGVVMDPRARTTADLDLVDAFREALRPARILCGTSMGAFIQQLERALSPTAELHGSDAPAALAALLAVADRPCVSCRLRVSSKEGWSYPSGNGCPPDLRAKREAEPDLPTCWRCLPDVFKGRFMGGARPIRTTADLPVATDDLSAAELAKLRILDASGPTVVVGAGVQDLAIRAAREIERRRATAEVASAEVASTAPVEMVMLGGVQTRDVESTPTEAVLADFRDAVTASQTIKDLEAAHRARRAGANFPDLDEVFDVARCLTEFVDGLRDALAAAGDMVDIDTLRAAEDAIDAGMVPFVHVELLADVLRDIKVPIPEDWPRTRVAPAPTATAREWNVRHWGDFLDARSALVRAMDAAGRPPAEIMELCNFNDETHCRAVIAALRTGHAVSDNNALGALSPPEAVDLERTIASELLSIEGYAPLVDGARARIAAAVADLFCAYSRQATRCVEGVRAEIVTVKEKLAGAYRAQTSLVALVSSLAHRLGYAAGVVTTLLDLWAAGPLPESEVLAARTCITRLTADRDAAYAQAAVPGSSDASPAASVYRERTALVAMLATLARRLGYAAGVADDPTAEDDFRTLVFVELPDADKGHFQASWHVGAAERHLIAHMGDYAGMWDGHTTAEKYARMARSAATFWVPHTPVIRERLKGLSAELLALETAGRISESAALATRACIEVLAGDADSAYALLDAALEAARDTLEDGTAEDLARALVADASDVDPATLSAGDVVAVANLVAEVKRLRLTALLATRDGDRASGTPQEGALRNCLLLARGKQLNPNRVGDWADIVRFCASAGVVPNVLRTDAAAPQAVALDDGAAATCTAIDIACADGPASLTLEIHGDDGAPRAVRFVAVATEIAEHPAPDERLEAAIEAMPGWEGRLWARFHRDRALNDVVMAMAPGTIAKVNEDSVTIRQADGRLAHYSNVRPAAYLFADTIVGAGATLGASTGRLHVAIMDDPTAAALSTRWLEGYPDGQWRRVARALAAAGIVGCGAHSCIFGHAPGSAGTNGGCMCIDNIPGPRPPVPTRRYIMQLAVALREIATMPVPQPAPRAGTPVEQVQSLLGLICVYVQRATIASWSLADREAATEYACAVHLHAGDNDVDVPARPAFLPPVENAIPEWWVRESGDDVAVSRARMLATKYPGVFPLAIATNADAPGRYERLLDELDAAWQSLSPEQQDACDQRAGGRRVSAGDAAMFRQVFEQPFTLGGFLAVERELAALRRRLGGAHLAVQDPRFRRLKNAPARALVSLFSPFTVADIEAGEEALRDLVVGWIKRRTGDACLVYAPEVDSATETPHSLAPAPCPHCGATIRVHHIADEDVAPAPNVELHNLYECLECGGVALDGDFRGPGRPMPYMMLAEDER